MLRIVPHAGPCLIFHHIILRKASGAQCAPYEDLFDNLKLMPFEDREFFGFEDYDEYLTNCYGDWRQLPPKEKQVANHIFNAWWKQ